MINQNSTSNINSKINKNNTHNANKNDLNDIFKNNNSNKKLASLVGATNNTGCWIIIFILLFFIMFV